MTNNYTPKARFTFPVLKPSDKMAWPHGGIYSTVLTWKIPRKQRRLNAQLKRRAARNKRENFIIHKAELVKQ